MGVLQCDTSIEPPYYRFIIAAVDKLCDCQVFGKLTNVLIDYVLCSLI